MKTSFRFTTTSFHRCLMKTSLCCRLMPIGRRLLVPLRKDGCVKICGWSMGRGGRRRSPAVTSVVHLLSLRRPFCCPIVGPCVGVPLPGRAEGQRNSMGPGRRMQRRRRPGRGWSRVVCPLGARELTCHLCRLISGRNGSCRRIGLNAGGGLE